MANKYISFSIAITFMSFIVGMAVNAFLKKTEIYNRKLSNLNFIKSEQLKKLFGITTLKKWRLHDFDKKTIFETSGYFNSTTTAGFTLLKLINFEILTNFRKI